MANMLGSVTPFDNKSQSWEEYCEILNHFFVANDVEEPEKKRAILLSCVGAQTYTLMRNLLSPERPGSKSYEDLVSLLKNHFNPKPSEIVQRWKFNSRNRHFDESIVEYVAELRKLAQDCNFGDTLTVMLRDRLVCGVNDDSIQRRLLAEEELTFETALRKAQVIEAANKDMVDLHRDKGNRMGTTVFKMDTGEKNKSSVTGLCYRCGGSNHGPKDCRFANEKCYNCGKMGHVKRVCRMKAQEMGVDKDRKFWKWGRGNQSKKANYLQEEEEEEEDRDEDVFTMYSIEAPQPHVPPITQILLVNEYPVKFEIDTGCSVTVVSQREYGKMEAKKNLSELKTSTLSLKTYTGQSVPVLGTTKVKVKHKGLTKELTAVVVAGSGPNLWGRSWLTELELSWEKVSKLKDTSELLQDILREHETVFKEELGTLKGASAKIHVPSDAKPHFFKSRSLPFAMREKVEAELERLIKDHIIEPVKFSEWAAPVVPVLKPDGSVQLCGDYRVTINRESSLEQYPIPRMEDMFAVLAGGEKFSKLDMSHAYQQILLDKTSQSYVTVNTHKGLFTYTRLPFGVSSSPAIFQRTMEGVLKDIPKVTVYLDDILLTGRDDQEHLRTLDQVLQRLEEAGLRLKRGKCEFMEKEVIFLGHKVDATGIHPVPEKVQAVQNAPRPTSVTELKAYLGLLNFYNRFLPNLSTLLAPLHQLLKKEVPWCWKEEQEEVFKKSKELLQSNWVLIHYDERKELVLSCDASAYGVGAVLAHRMADGTERPIGFVSRTLTVAEKNYSQLEKEGLAVVFGVKKFHKYLYGRKFVICTDHKPLLTLLNELKAVPQMVSQRIMRWAVMLGAYEYVISYRAGKDNGNADALSRLPVPETPEKEAKEDYVLMLDSVISPLTTSEQIKHWTTRDLVLSRVREYVLKGWPDHSNINEFAPVGSPHHHSRARTCRVAGTATSISPRYVKDERAGP